MIHELIPILVARSRQIVITFFLIVAGVVVLTLLTPKTYETHMKILVKGERANTSGWGSSGEVSENQVNTEIELLTSNDLLEKVVRATGLEHAERTGSVAPKDREAVAVEKAVKRLQKDIKITPVRKANIIEVKYSAKSPRLAADVLREYSEKYLVSHLKAGSAPGTYDFFAAQADHYKQELASIESTMAEFNKQGDIVLLEQQKESTLQKAVEAKSGLLQTEAAIDEYKSKMNDTTGQLSSVTGRVVTQSRVASNQYLAEHLSTMLAELQNKRTQLLTKFQPDDRSIRETDQEIADTKAAIEKAAKPSGVDQTTDVNPVRQNLEIEMAKEQADLAGLEARRQALSEQEKGYRDQLLKLDSQTAGHDELIRRHKEAEDNFVLYSRKSEEARIADSLDQQKISNVSIVETPSEPHLPSKPNVPLNLIAGTFLAACISLGTALSAEFLSQRISQPRQQPADLALSASAGSSLAYPGVGGSPYLLNTINNEAELEKLTGLPVLALLDHA